MFVHRREQEKKDQNGLKPYWVYFVRVRFYLVRRCWDQDGVFQLGEGLLDVKQHAWLKQICSPETRRTEMEACQKLSHYSHFYQDKSHMHNPEQSESRTAISM